MERQVKLKLRTMILAGVMNVALSTPIWSTAPTRMQCATTVEMRTGTGCIIMALLLLLLSVGSFVCHQQASWRMDMLLLFTPFFLPPFFLVVGTGEEVLLLCTVGRTITLTTSTSIRSSMLTAAYAKYTRLSCHQGQDSS